jgi:hypothetical protein
MWGQVNIHLSRGLAGRWEVDWLLAVDAKMSNPVRIQVK